MGLRLRISVGTARYVTTSAQEQRCILRLFTPFGSHWKIHLKEISYLALFGLRVYGSVDRNVPNLGTWVLGYFRNYSANLLLLVL